uniref:Uncharacterized protein n=1 Tax=Ackermannviridae sp. TaxID=2831612 RepID=A0A8S5VMP9_9CAUD|nr:MAG TPA: hypothetical protein [Ackermannviridae sp.]
MVCFLLQLFMFVNILVYMMIQYGLDNLHRIKYSPSNVTSVLTSH